MKIQGQIEQKLLSAFEPEHLDVCNESAMHAVPPGSETHFKVVLVSNTFNGQRLLERHRRVNKVLAQELAEQVHAMALHTYTPHEWQTYYSDVPASPNCAGKGS